MPLKHEDPSQLNCTPACPACRENWQDERRLAEARRAESDERTLNDSARNVLVQDGRTAVREWARAGAGYVRTHRAFKAAEAEFRDAETRLGQWLLPADAEVGEKIAVWVGDSLFQAMRTPEGVSVQVRTRGRHFTEEFE